MGGRGSSSATSRFYANQRAGFARIAQAAEKGSNTVRNRDIAEVARAAEGLTGTERAHDLVREYTLGSLRRELENAHGIVSAASVLGDMERAVEASAAQQPYNNPLGSGMSSTEWLATADAISGYIDILHSAGYTDAEIAAGVVYGNYIRRDR